MSYEFKIKSERLPFTCRDKKSGQEKTLYPVEIFINEPYFMTVNLMTQPPAHANTVVADLTVFHDRATNQDKLKLSHCVAIAKGVK